MAGGGSGASNAERVPGGQAHRRRRGADATPRRAPRRPRPSRAARRGRSWPVAAPIGPRPRHRPRSRAPRRSPPRCARAAASLGRPPPALPASAGGAGGARRALADAAASRDPPFGGGRSAAQVEPTDERLCAAIQWTRSSCAGESRGSRSTRRVERLEPRSAPSRTATTIPTARGRLAGARRARWPGATTQPSGTRYENA